MRATIVGLMLLTQSTSAQTPTTLFERDNLVAWCIVPFDAKKRGPEERVAMLKRLGFRRYAYDWRAAHLPTFDREVELLLREGIALEGIWFPASLNKDAQTLLAILDKHKVRTRLWVSLQGGALTKDPDEQGRRVAQTVLAIRPIAEAAAKIGCTVGLYNHGAWFGEPENQLAVIEALGRKDVGIVYNLHHGHDHLDRFPSLLERMRPHLVALNLNGMFRGGDREGKKIWPLGHGDLDLKLLQTIAASGWRGPIGILGHTNDDAEARLSDNLDGLKWLVPQLQGKAPGPKPTLRTQKTAAAPAAAAPGWLAAGRTEYRTPPLTVECQVRLATKTRYNILLASDTKRSSAHWELFTLPGQGWLTAYLPGMRPDHVRSKHDLCDGKVHRVAMHFEADRVRLYVDGTLVADEAIVSTGKPVVPAELAFARLVEGSLGCDGDVLAVRLSRGVRPVDTDPKTWTPDERTLGLWRFDKADAEVRDASALGNPARRAAVAAPASAAPPPGVHLHPAMPGYKAVLIDRSPDEAYLAVRPDSMGRLFVGGREKVFVFEPNDAGGFGPRQELLRFPKDSIIIGLELRGDDLYVLASHGLYLVPGGRVARTGLKAQRILWGVPLDLHVSFHCLAWGPDGRLYLNHGDPLLNYGDWSRPDHWNHWTLFAGPKATKHSYTGTGAVLSVRPDGSDPRVVARGLRGPVGLAFDRDWNLFTNDNDHESKPDQYAPARLLHVTPHADFAWPRGWMASKSPDRADLLESIHTSLGRGVPCDLVWTDAPEFPGNLLMCRWDRMAVTRYPLRPHGASFAAEERDFARGEHLARPSGIALGRDGRVFVTSLYLGGNVVSPYCPSDVVMLVPTDRFPVPRFDETRAPVEDLWRRLSHASWEERRVAHLELLRRGPKVPGTAVARMKSVADDDPAAVHLPWLAALAGDRRMLEEAARDKSRPRRRLQALRALAEPGNAPESKDIFSDALTDPDPVIRLAGVVGLVQGSSPLPMPRLVPLLTGSDLVLRQTTATLIARRGSDADLESLFQSSDPATRLGAVLASGTRLTVPRPDAVAPTGVPLHYPKESSFFKSRLLFADAAEPVDLAALGPIGSYTTAQAWNARKHGDDEDRLFTLMVRALDDPRREIRSQAAYYLGWLRDPRSESAVERVRRELRGGDLVGLTALHVTQAWQVGPFAERGANAEYPPEMGVLDLTAKYAGAGGDVTWSSAKASGTVWAGSAAAGTVSHLCFRIQSRDRQPALFTVKAEGGPRVFHNGRLLPTPKGEPWLLDLEPGSNDLIVRLPGSGSAALEVRAKGSVTLTIPEKAEGATLAARLRESKNAKLSAEFFSVDWASLPHKGDADRGRRLFGQLGCVRCHAIVPQQAGNGAPSLAEAGKRFTAAYLAESILLPDRQVAEAFRATLVTTTKGLSLTGLVVRESPEEIELLQTDGTRRVVARSEVEERRALATSVMPAGVVQSPQELGDLLAYLLSDRPLPP